MKHTESRAATCFSPAYCDVCQSYYGESRSHTESRAATCFSAAYCDVCQSYYGEPRSHDWGEWMYYDSKSDQRFCQYADCDKKEFAPHHWGAWLKADETSHYHECQASDCSQREYADHTVKTPANCTDPAVCSVCSSSYGDTNPNNHKGPPASTITGFTKEEHTVTETCGACGAALSQTSEGHNWGEWTFHFAGGHYRICLSSGCGMGETESHTGGNPDCTRWATCDVCHGTYNDKTKHEDLIQFDAQASTCTESGWNAYVMFPHCYYSTISRIPPLGHDRVQHDAQAATCTEIGWDAYQACSRCDYSTYSEKSALGHSLVNHAAQAPTCTEIGWDAYITCKRCEYSSYAEKKALGHSLVSHAAQAPTCTEIGWDAYVTCSRCDYSTYSEKKALGHSLVNHAAQAATCTQIDWDAYQTCSRCGYSSYQELPALGHLYGEWISNADGTDTASCQRGCGFRNTVVRANLAPIQPTDDAAAEITLSPVSGEVSDGTQLALVEAAAAEALTETLPEGALVVRMGTLESGETLLSVAFELGGKLTRPTGQVKLILPAEMLEGYALSLIDGDGTETPIDLDIQEDEASFVLDFSDSQLPTRLIRLVPLA